MEGSRLAEYRMIVGAGYLNIAAVRWHPPAPVAAISPNAIGCIPIPYVDIRACVIGRIRRTVPSALHGTAR